MHPENARRLDHDRGAAAQTALLGGTVLWCFAILAAPAAGAAFVYDFFSLVCHQDPSRSWHMMQTPLPVCIRCTSIYFAFLLSLTLKLPGSVRWLRLAIVMLAVEFVIARLFADIAAARVVTGLTFGATAAPFIRKGVGELSGSM